MEKFLVLIRIEYRTRSLALQRTTDTVFGLHKDDLVYYLFSVFMIGVFTIMQAVH